MPQAAQRADYRQTVPAYKALQELDAYIASSELDPAIVELVKIRVSQINGCESCLQYHLRAAQRLDVAPAKVSALPYWGSAQGFSDKERASLAWAEALTLIAGRGISDAQYEAARQHYSEGQLVDLSYAVASINAFNRLSIAFRRNPPA